MTAVSSALIGYIAGYGSAPAAPSTPGDLTEKSSSPVDVPAQAGTRLGGAEATAANEHEAAESNQNVAPPEASPKAGPRAHSPARRAKAARAPSAADATPEESNSKEARAGLPKKPPASTFYEELVYLKRAQAALKSGDAALALGLMKSLDDQQPGGALLAERRVTKVLALCQLGNESGATKVAREIAAHGSASVYAERLEHSCASSVFQTQTSNSKN